MFEFRTVLVLLPSLFIVPCFSFLKFLPDVLPDKIFKGDPFSQTLQIRIRQNTELQIMAKHCSPPAGGREVSMVLSSSGMRKMEWMSCPTPSCLFCVPGRGRGGAKSCVQCKKVCTNNKDYDCAVAAALAAGRGGGRAGATAAAAAATQYCRW